jgi:opacity protein-like surface antigen
MKFSRSLIQKSLSFVFFTLMIAPFCFGQDEPKKVEIFGGYSYLYSEFKDKVETENDLNSLINDEADTDLFRINTSLDDKVSLHGFNGSATFYFSKYVGVTGDVSGHYGRMNIRTTVTPENIVCIQIAPSPCSPFTIKIAPKLSQHTFLVGPQIKARNSKVAPFARAMIGMIHEKASLNNGSVTCEGAGCQPFSVTSNLTIDPNNDSDTSFAYGFGGGLDVKVSDRFSLRLIQADIIGTRVDGEHSGSLRLSTGIVF